MVSRCPVHVLVVQGDDAVHDAVRIRELEAAVPRRVVTALKQHGTSNDDVLWAALFVLAVLVRDNSSVFDRATAALAHAGVLKVKPSLYFLYTYCHLLGWRRDCMEPLSVSAHLAAARGRQHSSGSRM